MTPSNYKWTPELFGICAFGPGHVPPIPPPRRAHWHAQHRFDRYHGLGEAIFDQNSLPALQRPPPDVPSISHCLRSPQESAEEGIESTPLVNIGSPQTVSSDTTVVVEEASKLDEKVFQTSFTTEGY